MANTEFTPSRTPAGTPNPLDEILAIHHLKRCYFVQLRCAEHGEIRMALPESATQLGFAFRCSGDESNRTADVFKAEVTITHRCPSCWRSCDGVLLGFGGTTRPLPFWSVRQGVQALEAPGVRND